jgi:GNAT superfamily N-acetyltransferase
MLTLQVEYLRDIQGEVQAYGEKQWAEIRYPPLMQEELDPAVDTLLRIEEEGSLLLVTAREAGQMAGYIMVVSSPMLNHQEVNYAMELAMYVGKDYRRCGVARSLMQYCEEVCREAGVHYLTFSVTPTLDYTPLLEAEGYIKTEILHTKRL